MQERSPSPPFRDILIFAVICILALVVYPLVMRKVLPPANVANAPAEQEKKNEQGGEAKKEEKAKPGEPPKAANSEKSANPKEVKPAPGKEEKPAAGPAKAPAAKPAVPPVKKIEEPIAWATLGSADPDLKKNPYRMLVTVSSQGASVARIELSNERYRDLDDRSGYLGHLVMDDSTEANKGPGCLVQVVGPGTPAANAGVRAGDRILKVTCQGKSTEIKGAKRPAEVLELAFRKTKPGQTAELEIQRGKEAPFTVTVGLIGRPLEVVRPERKQPNTEWIENGPLDAIDLKDNCPFSFLMTLQGVDDKSLPTIDADAKWNDANWAEVLNEQLAGVELRQANWHIESQTDSKVVFSCPVPQYHLTITKTYELSKIEGKEKASDDPAYHLTLSLQLTNDDTQKHEVAYRIDGPNGLPVEGSWYVTTKVGRGWSGEGLRDVDYQLAGENVDVATASQLSQKDKFFKVIGEATQFKDHLPDFFGVDAQYFNVSMILRGEGERATAANLDRAVALRMGDVVERRFTLTNTSCRLISKPLALEAKQSSPPQRFVVFAGPKRPELLAQPEYHLSGVITYGWPIFEWVAKPLTAVLEFFYSIVHNYGVAIILLTMCVRLAMFPISRHQVQSAQMMQKIQPEIKEIQKRFKKDPEGARKAQQELFAKHNYNPLGGCLPMFIQIPIFIGLYRALQIDVELRGAPLISDSIRWCSNLAAPDMLFDWSSFMPAFVNNGQGMPGLPILGPMLGLGPYFNLFPAICLVLYLVQQKVMMPPPADEQAAQQQKIMKYVMFVIGLMLFKIAAGLCLYFIVQTVWGLLERRFLPTTATSNGAASDEVPSRLPPKPDRPSNAEREAIRRKKNRKR